MKIVTLLVETVGFDPRNARKHSARNLEAIKASLTQFGQQKPIVVRQDPEGYVVIAGNGTLAAAKALGWDEIKCAITELEGDNIKAFALADNRSAELAEWDQDVLSATLKELTEEDFDVKSLGFDFDFSDPVKPEEKPVKEKKLQKCPNCSHEF